MDDNLNLQDSQGDKEPFSTLAGKTEALNEAHIEARITLIRLCGKLPEWPEMCRKLGTQTGWEPAALASSRAIDAVLTIAKIPTLPEFIEWLNKWEKRPDGTTTLTLDYPDDTDAEAIQQSFQRALDELVETFGRFELVFVDKKAHKIATDTIIAFVRDRLGLPWAWLAYELYEQFAHALIGIAMQEEHIKQLWYEPYDEVVPLYIPELKITKNDSANEAETKLLNMMRTFMDYVTNNAPSPSVPRGKARTAVAKHVEWMFRQKVLGESINCIALQPDQTETPESRANIKRGINAAIGILSIAPEVWPDVVEANYGWGLIDKFWAASDD